MALDWSEEHEQGTSIALSLHWLPQQPNESEKLRTSTTHKKGKSALFKINSGYISLLKEKKLK